jgi:aldehyde:ferredoxin oxidoreductase
MAPEKDPIYTGKFIRVNLTDKKVNEEVFDQERVREYVGGTGLGARILYDEVAPGVEWAHPDNRIILATGPLGGTRAAGSGTFSLVTKGALTNGGTATQANGFFGAYLKLNGLAGVVIQGASDQWVYLYIHDGKAELRDAQHLLNKDTWETEDIIKKELGYKEKGMSIFGIGPAGENLVKFAGVVGDKGPAAPHNGSGAVMGSKKLKAIAIARGKNKVPVFDSDKVATLVKQMHEDVMEWPVGNETHKWGTSMGFPWMLSSGNLPIKNMNTNLFPNYEPFLGENYRENKSFEMKPTGCWACPSTHLHIMKVTDGPYAGYVGEEPEYECWALFGPNLMNDDVRSAFVLSNEVDKLGMDVNEAGWLMSFVTDCYERGIIGKEDTDGLEMTWGNVEAVRQMLHKVAKREGFGNILAEGVKRAAEQIGGEALKYAAYIQKGHAPRGHDHRARWTEMLDYATSNQGTIETGPCPVGPDELKLPPLSDTFSPDHVPFMVAKAKPGRQFVDMLGVCVFRVGLNFTHIVDLVNAVTGWTMNVDEAFAAAERQVNLMRAFNIRHGVSTAVEAPSTLYSSVPVDGPAEGKDVKPHWDHMLDEYYKHMGWDRKSGRPLVETLRKLGLEAEARDLWRNT